MADGETVTHIILFASYGTNIFSFFLFILLFIAYIWKKTNKNMLVICQIQILCFGFILSLCHIIGIYIFVKYDLEILNNIQGYLRLLSFSGIQSTQLGIISLNLISFRFPVFMYNYKKASTLIIFLIIYFPIAIYIIPEIIYALIKKQSVVRCNSVGLCFARWTLNYQIALDCVYGIIFLCILISLHCLIKKYFKQHTDDSDKPYISKLRTYYIALCFSFPTILTVIFEIIEDNISTPNLVFSYIVVCLEILINEICPLIVAMTYCFNWILIKEMFCYKKKIIDEKTNIFNDLLINST